ncbi:MAG: hypothetical protein IJ565_04610 [Bacilli bacterium]|nr:hypothetical protein [Bacilli bacterium]
MSKEPRGWSGIFFGMIGLMFIAFPIGFIVGIFSEKLGAITFIGAFIIGFIYLVYNEFGTKEKREQAKKDSDEKKKEYYNKTHNSDGTRKTRKQIAQESAEKELKRINNLGVFPTKIISKDFVSSVVYIDDNNERILFKTFYNEYVVNYDDILDYELIVDDTTQLKYSLSTAITGTVKTKGVVSNILVNIYLNNIDNPIIEVRSLGDGAYHNVNSMEAYNARKFADELVATLLYIKNKKKK